MGSANCAVTHSMGAIQQNCGVKHPPLLCATGTAESLKFLPVCRRQSHRLSFAVCHENVLSDSLQQNNNLVAAVAAAEPLAITVSGTASGKVGTNSLPGPAATRASTPRILRSRSGTSPTGSPGAHPR